MLRTYDSTARKHDGPYETILELTNVSRPAVRRERPLGVRRETHRLDAGGLTRARDQLSGEQWNIAGSFTKWREFDLDDAKPIVGIFAEFTGTNHLLERPMGCRDD